MRKLIIHSPKYGEKVILYDDNDHDLISKYHWWVIISKKFKKKKKILSNRFYCCSSIRISNKRRMIQMHQLILGFPKKDIDHRNGNGLDNRKKNIRTCTSSQNARNRSLRSDNISGYKGVAWHIHIKKYGSNIWFEGRRIHLGYFEKPVDAGSAYNHAAKKYFGKFARLNVIPS